MRSTIIFPLLLPLLPLFLFLFASFSSLTSYCLQKDSLVSREELALSPFLLLLPRLRLWYHLLLFFLKGFYAYLLQAESERHILTLIGAL